METSRLAIGVWARPSHWRALSRAARAHSPWATPSAYLRWWMARLVQSRSTRRAGPRPPPVREVVALLLDLGVQPVRVRSDAGAVHVRPADDGHPAGGIAYVERGAMIERPVKPEGHTSSRRRPVSASESQTYRGSLALPTSTASRPTPAQARGVASGPSTRLGSAGKAYSFAPSVRADGPAPEVPQAPASRTATGSDNHALGHRGPRGSAHAYRTFVPQMLVPA